MSDETYNGWSNRETWALNLWLSNDQGLYEMVNERVRDARTEHALDNEEPYNGYLAGEVIKDLWEELTDPNEGLMTAETILEMVRDIGSEYRVDWTEIGANWLSDLDD